MTLTSLLRAPERKTERAEEVKSKVQSQQSVSAAEPQSGTDQQRPRQQKELKCRRVCRSSHILYSKLVIRDEKEDDLNIKQSIIAKVDVNEYFSQYRCHN